MMVSDTRGNLTIHPFSEGVNVSANDYFKQAVQIKNGFITYIWKNRNENVERSKAAAIAYYAPLDMMVWTTAEHKEFIQIIDRTSFSNMFVNNNSFAKFQCVLLAADGSGLLDSVEGYRPVTVSEITDANGVAYYKEILDSGKESGTFFIKRDFDGKVERCLMYYSLLPEFEAYSVTFMPSSRLFYVIKDLSVNSAIMISFFILLSIVASYSFRIRNH
jgi:hypothetical protein